jgi:lipopolysaccharide transport system ATP-binding protein
MFSEEIIVGIRNLNKYYEVYQKPSDRLKQLIVSGLIQSKKISSCFNLQLGAVTKKYYSEFWALHNINLEIRRGETIGIIGRNGSGKSTLLQIICGILKPSSGDLYLSGRVAALLELGSGFNPEFSGRENVFLNARVLGLRQEEIIARYQEIIAFADIGDFIDQPVKTYSSGMFVRLAFAVQAHIDADLVVIDEALAVGDVFFRQKCYRRLEELRSSGAAIILVSHSMPDIEQYCDRAILLDRGNSVFVGPAKEAVRHYYILEQSSSEFVNSNISCDRARESNSSIISELLFPPMETKINISGKNQIGNGQAECIGLWLCDSNEQPARSFSQGDVLVVFYEFILREEIGIPICGLVISDQRGVIVHGKASDQFELEVEPSCEQSSSIRVRQEVLLDLAQGEYILEVGLASMTEADWNNRKSIPFEQLEALFTRICHVPEICSFSVSLALNEGVSYLTHHGLANLGGKMMIACEPAKKNNQY